MNLGELNYLSFAFLETLVGTAFRWACFAALCTSTIWLLRACKPELKHFLWSGALYAVLVLPLLQIAAPPLRRAAPLLPQPRIDFLPPQPKSGSIDAIVVASSTSAPAGLQNAPRPFPWMLFGASLYLAVTAVLLGRLALSVWRIRGIVRRSEPILDPDFRGLVHDVWLESLANAKPRVRLSRDVNSPLAAEFDEPIILLPVSWQAWSHEKLRAVLAHEMAHVRRGDPDTALSSSIAVCLFWFHPLAYWLRRQLATSAEEACDEAVLDFVRPERYAQILIEFAGPVSLTGGHLLAMSGVAADRSQIAKRIERIFAPRSASRISVRLVQAMAVALLCPALYLTAAARFQTEQAEVTTVNGRLMITGQQQLRELEATLQSDPNNMKLREDLMAYYLSQHDAEALAKQRLWVIEHHPESQMAMVLLPSETSDAKQYEQMKAAWEGVLAKRPDSATVLCHAGMFFALDDPLRAMALYGEANRLSLPGSPEEKAILRATALLYMAAVVENLTDPQGIPGRVNGIYISSADAAKLRADLALSQDPALLSEVGTVLSPLFNGNPVAVSTSVIVDFRLDQ